ncbi:MAG: VWA domain-containing protein [Planctomycetota bacterium]|nr:VWA domain-containing protein [Planctomycetota bacterium]
MGDGYHIALERPIALFLLLLIPWMGVWAWRHRAAIGSTRTWIIITVRSLLIALLALSLAQPTALLTGRGVTSMVVLDASESIPPALAERARKVVETAIAQKTNTHDRLGLVIAGRDAVAVSMPSSAPNQLDDAGLTARDGTDLDGAVRRALALLPPDTSNRLLLISDGNETVGSLRDAAKVARAVSVPIDVIVLPYAHANESVFESLRAPTRVRIGQPFDLKAVVRSQSGASGRLLLWQGGTPVDLDPASPGDGVAITLRPGSTTLELPVLLQNPGATRFRALFEPDADSGDGLHQNNVGSAIVFVGDEGRVLILDETESESHVIVEALHSAGINVDVIPPSGADDPMTLAAYDAVILANVGRYEISNALDRGLRAYVSDLGGGLWMVGGDRSFGAGGWIGSDTEKVLPVRLDPPATRELPRGALVLVMHSCELPQGNYWAEKIALAAIDSLSAQDYLGIVSFAWSNTGANGCSWQFPIQLAGDKVDARIVAQTMSVGDMPDFTSSMDLALEGLGKVKAAQKHVIVISDGDPSPPNQATLDRFRSQGITITTIMVAGHGTATDLQNMRAVAEQTGGTFHNVINPKLLPRIVTKEATLITRSLIAEGEFAPQVVAQLSGPLSGVSSVPGIDGYVVTVPREGLAQVAIVNRSADAKSPGRVYDDPIFAWWNHGTGRCAALTTDITGRWGTKWIAWGGVQPLVERTTRWLMRPAAPQDVVVRTAIDGETITVEVETVGGESRVSGRSATILRPDGTVGAVRLDQVAPGRWSGTFAGDQQGAYLVQVPVANGAGGAVVQAAVSISYAREYRSVRDNGALLREVAESTGGRLLTLDDAVGRNIFLADGLTVPQATRRIWDLLAVIAAVWLIVDIAVRRLVIDSESGRSLFLRFFGGGASTATGGSDALRRIRRAKSVEATPVDTASTDERATPSHSSSASPRVEVFGGSSGTEKSSPPTTHAEQPSNESELPPLERLRRARDRARDLTRNAEDGQEKSDG